MWTNVTCFVADDHPAVLRFVGSYLEDHDIALAGTACDGREALRQLLALEPDVALLDLHMPGLGGIGVAGELASAGCPTRVVLYTGFGDRDVLADALATGIAGLVQKDSPPGDLVQAIRHVAAGGTYVDPVLATALLHPQATERRPLTPRERDALELLAEGLSYDEMGGRLGISGETMRTHVRKAMERLHADTRTQAVATAIRLALIS